MLGTSKSVWGFDPRSVPGCQLWLDAADSSTITLSGTKVTQWNDKSGNGYNFTQSTSGNQPTYSVASQNNQNTITFTSANSTYLLGTASTNFIGTNSLSVYGVFKTNDRNSGASVFSKSLYGSAEGRILFGYRDPGTPGTIIGGIGGQFANVFAAISDTYTAGAWRTFGFVSDRSGWTNTTYQNGTSIGTATVSSNTTTNLTNAFPMLVGAYNNSSGGANPPQAGYYLDGTVGELLLFSTALTTSQRQQIEGYLAHKWGLTGYYDSSIPLTIPGCQLWLDGRDTSSMTFSGSTITQWNDKSGNGYNATIAPDRVGAIYSTDYNAVNFASSTTGYITNYSAAPTNETMFVVGNNPSPSGANNIIIGGVQGARSLGLGYTNAGTGTIGNLNTQVAWLASVGGYTAGTTALVRSQFTPSSNSVSFNGGSTATGGAPGFTVGRVTYLGVDATNGYFHYNGYMMEALFYNRILTTTEIQTIEGYLAKKWGIGSSSTIPSTHPFSSIPPYLRVFQPNDIPGCQLWLDAADLSSLTLSGSNLTAIRDKSGVTTPTVTPGFLYASNSLNGHGVIYNNNGHIRGTFPTPFTSSIHTTFIVAVADSLPSDGTRLMSFRAPGGLPIRPLDYAFGSFRYLVRNPNTTGQQVTAFTNRYFIWTCYNSSSNLGLRLNGATDLTTNITTNPTTITGYGFGWNDEGDSQVNFPGKIAESLVFNTALTTAQIQQIEGYLAHKWGLTPSYSTTLPLTIPGCSLWLDAADATTVVQSSGNISQWNDKSASALTATAVNNPTIVANVQNGLPGVSLNGSNQYFNLGNNLNMLTNQLYIFVVCKFNSTADGAIIGKSLLGGAVGRYSLLRIGGTLNPLVQGTGGGNDSGVNSDTNTSTRLLNMIWDRNTIVLYQNGSSVFSVGLSEPSSVTNSYSLLIGAYQNGSGGTPPAANLYMNGFIHEILVYFTPTSSPLTTSQRQQIEGYLGRKWGIESFSIPSTHPFSRFPPASLDNTPISATGGTITTSGSYKIHTFTTVGTTIFTLTSSVSISAEVLVVAGGGGGGHDDGGGGGAGGVIYSQSFTITSGSYTITLGDGGTSGTSGGVDGGNGGNTTFSSLTAIGGGGGATSDRNGKNGGSGGGVGWGASTPGTGTAGQGNAGGGGTSGPNYCAGGGGGAGGVGGTGAGTLPGNGGIGVSYTIAGTTYSVGGGGGGGLAVQNPGNIRSTASHGGGNGAGHGSVAPGSGSPNTGGGGGGGNNEQATNGGTGGSGIVIIAYKT